MKSVCIPSKKIPIIGTYDVVICGGGPSGFVAAIAAARNGAKTLLIERYGFLGGTATGGLVSPISVFNKKSKRIVGGIPLEFIEQLEKIGGAIINYPSGNIHFDPELYKLTAQRMVCSANVKLLLHTYLSNCICSENDPGKVTHIVIENKSGQSAVEAKYFIDCTGDGDLISMAGLPYEVGDSNSGELQPMTMWFRLGGVDTGNLENMHMIHERVRYYNKRISDRLKELNTSTKVPKFGGPWFTTTLHKGEATVNMTRYAGNGVDIKNLTEAECTLREDVFTLVMLLKENFPEFKNCYVMDTSVQVGVRETRRIDGIYKMTVEDIIYPKDFPDTVAKGAHPIDVHRADSTGQDVHFLNDSYSIPYRALIPKGSRNVLVAGRCISATREAFASIRVQAQCMALGQAAGTAAALCNEKDIYINMLDGRKLRNILSKQGAIV